MDLLPENQAAKRLRIYISESDRWQGKPLYATILSTLIENGLSGATVLRGVASFGANSKIHSASILSVSDDLPLIIDIIDSKQNIELALEILYPIVNGGLMTVEDVFVVKYTHRFLHPLPSDRLTSEAMTKEVIYLQPDWPVQKAWQCMLENNIKALPVINAAKEVIGMLTDEDLLERAGINQRLSIANRMDASLLKQEIISLRESKLLVRDVMTQPVITATGNEALGLAASRMIKAGLKRMPVINENNQLIGVVSRLDILRQVASLPSEAVKKYNLVENACTVGDIMDPVVPKVPDHANLTDIVKKALETNSRRLIVIDHQERVIGLISDSDIVTRVHSSFQQGIMQALKNIGKPPASKLAAKQIMSPGALTAPPDLPIINAIQLMLDNNRKWLVVIDQDERALGLVDRHILFRTVTSYYHQSDGTGE